MENIYSRQSGQASSPMYFYHDLAFGKYLCATRFLWRMSLVHKTLIEV